MMVHFVKYQISRLFRYVSEQQQAMVDNKKRFVCDKYQEDHPNVWVKLAELKAGREAEDIVDLAMGSPTFPTPDILLQGLAKIARDPFYHKPPPLRGIPSLLAAISELYSPLFRRPITPDQVITSLGAQGVLYLAMRALIREGDEVILLEPAFECYATQVRASGGVPVFVPYDLTPTSSPPSADDWRLDPAKLESALSPRTSLLVLNNPNNPLGKALSGEEVEMVAAFCREHQLLVLSDEVYEWMVFEGRTHVRIAGLEGMWERTLSVYTAGKLFSATGWRLGWGVGPSHLISRLEGVKERSGISGCATLEYAVAGMISREAKLLETGASYLCQLRDELEKKRDRLYSAIIELGLSPVKSSATYFLLLEAPRCQEISDSADSPGQAYDYTFSVWMFREFGLLSLPVSAFCRPPSKVPDRFVRLCFAKRDETLELAVRKLASLKQRLDALSPRVEL